MGEAEKQGTDSPPPAGKWEQQLKGLSSYRAEVLIVGVSVVLLLVILLR